MFINISNHPSIYWTTVQFEVASQWGRVIDYSFPQVSPDSNVEEIEELARKVVSDINNLTENEPRGNVLHIMGEMNLTYLLVSYFISEGYQCVASTTQRVSEMSEDGAKISRFQFVQFRNYSLLNKKNE